MFCQRLPFLELARLLLGPGPSGIHPRVLLALAQPTIGHLDPEFVKLMDRIQAGLRRLFRGQIDEQRQRLAGREGERVAIALDARRAQEGELQPAHGVPVPLTALTPPLTVFSRLHAYAGHRGRARSPSTVESKE